MRSPLAWTLVIVLSAAGNGRAAAEMLSVLFPDSIPGYDTADGVTVQSRLHPDQMPLGLRAGTFRFWPTLSEGFGYTSNVLPSPYRQGSWQIVTEPALTVASDWSRNAFGAVLSAQDTRYLSQPDQDRTDATLSAGGRTDIGENQLSLAAAQLFRHEDPAQLDALPSDQPIAFQIQDVRASYAWNGGRWSLVPSLELSNWTYDSTAIMGVPTSEAYRDRLVTQGAVALRYEWAPLRNILFVLRALGQDYTRTPAGQTTPDSTGYQALTGFDYDDNAVWRWRLLIGGEARRFASPVYPQQNTLIAEAGVTWAPSGMTTAGLTFSRETADAAQEGVSGLIYTAARLTIDYEILRNLLLKATFGAQRADFFQGGCQFGSTAGFGLVWAVNRSVRVSFTYDQTEVQPSHGQPGTSSPGYSRGLGLIAFRIGL
nr:outer membrane beta-barrel protein [uncultured Rhodopila sp.]